MGKSKSTLLAFLCHSSSDKLAVEKYYERLSNDGISAWLDKNDLIPGQTWEIEIPKAVRNSHVVIVFLSSNSITKEGFVQKEIKIALDIADEKPDGTIFVIPARLEICYVPDRLSKFQWVDLFENDGYGRLLKALQTRANSLNILITPQKFLATNNIENFFSKLECANAENHQFALVAEKIYNWIHSYELGSAAHKEYLGWFQELSNNVHKDTAGKLIFTPKQFAVMSIIQDEMKRAGFVITLAAKDDLHNQLTLLAHQYPCSRFLENAFFPPFINQSKQDLEVTGFIYILGLGTSRGWEILQDDSMLIQTVGESNALRMKTDLKLTEKLLVEFPYRIIDEFWRNPGAANLVREVYTMINNFAKISVMLRSDS